MQLIRLTPAHAQAYRTLMLEAYGCHPDAFTSSVEERAALPLSWWERRLQVGDAADEMVWGATVKGQLAGVAGLAFERREKTRHKCTLFGMYVAQAHRSRGCARALVDWLLQQAAARPGVRLVQLTVTEGNAAAQRLYGDCGFQTFGVEPDAVAVGDRYVAKVHMWRAL